MHDEIGRAGFTDVVRVRYKWPIGAWSNDAKLKELGRWVLIFWYEGLEGWVLRFFTKHMGVSNPVKNTLTAAMWPPETFPFTCADNP